MVSRVDIALSRALIARARKRLRHQASFVDSLGFCTKPQQGSSARDVMVKMQIKLALVIDQHRNLLDQVCRG